MATRTPRTSTPRTRPSYHHGDLRAELVRAGAELAAKGGPDAIVLREVTRIVGVAPNAVYTHFATLARLKAAVSQHALREMAAAMQARLAGAPDPAGAPGAPEPAGAPEAPQAPDPAESRAAAEAHLREVGRAYVHFALAEPGLFRTAMDGNPAGVGTPGEHDPRPAGPLDGEDADGRPKPDLLLITALQRLSRAGGLPAEDIGAAVMASWATVHGLATILLNLQPDRSAAEREAAVDAGLHYLLQGLTR